MQDCIFCKIGSKEIPAKIIYEDEDVFATLDIHPRSPGHTMVIPKVHVPNLAELPDDKIEPLFKAVKKVVKLLKNHLNPEGFTIGINQGVASGQEVDHLHIHVMPRWTKDKGSSIQSVVNNPSDVNEIFEKLV